jgi:hypothetical protein
VSTPTIVNESPRYLAADGHVRVAPMVLPRSGGAPHPVYSWARCVDDCPRCWGSLEDI